MYSPYRSGSQEGGIMNKFARGFGVVVAALIAAVSAQAQSDGPNSPGTVVSDAGLGSMIWASPGNASASDNVKTFASVGLGAPTQLLKATNFGFALPPTAIIKGIEVSVEKNSAFADVTDNAVRIVKGGAFGATDRSDGAAWPAAPTEATIIYGSPTDLWGETWTVADINGAGFGAGISGGDGISGDLAQVDHIEITVYYSLCGDNILASGEQCDDGNVAAGDCCSPTCQFESNGSPCLDGDLCNGDEACDGAGNCDPAPDALDCDDDNPCTQDTCDAQDGCQSVAQPKPMCKTADKSILIYKDKGDNTKDKIIFKWIKGALTTVGELGTPTSTTDYALCVYGNYVGTTGASIANYNAPAGAPKWKTIGTKGYKYKDPAGSPEGVTKVILKSGAAGKSKVLVKGKGGNLPDPTVPFTLPVVAQVVNSDNATCFEGVFPAATKNAAGLFKAKVQ